MRANRKRSIVAAAALVSVVLTVAACGDDDEENAQTESTTTPTSGPATTEPETVSTAEPTTGPPTTDGEPPSADHVCPHVTNVVLVKNNTPDVEPVIPSDLAVEVLDPNGLPGFLGWALPPDIDAGEALATMFRERSITAYQIQDDTDSLDAAAEIEKVNDGGAEIIATPLLLLTLTGHWTLSPWGPPQVATTPGTVPTGSVDDSQTVAVVDTGYTASAQFDWLNQRVAGVDATFDADPGDPSGSVDVIAGHGKFVSSIIAQEANVAVRVARLGATSNAAVPTGLQNAYTADELLLYIAIQRLLNLGNKLGFSYSALNLSLGAYACEELKDDELGDPSVVDNSGLAIRAAVDLWNNAFGDSNPPILAAAGNHQPGYASALPPFLPAAYATNPSDHVVSVMSIDGNGNPSDFSNPGTCGARGELLGVGANDNWVYWRGSSFATALLTAKTVLGVGAGASACSFTTTNHVSIAPPTTTTTTPPNTTTSSTPGSTATTTTRAPTSPTTTTPG
jgi:hypothetical protein